MINGSNYILSVVSDSHLVLYILYKLAVVIIWYFPTDYNFLLQQNYMMYLNFVDTSVCLREVDGEWNISWPHATRGQVVQQKCPGGAESLGIHYNFNSSYT